MTLVLDEGDVQDISDILLEDIKNHNALTMIAKRFNCLQEARGTPESSSLGARVYSLIDNLNGDDTLLRIMQYMIGKMHNVSNISSLTEILEKHGYTIQNNNGHYTLVTMTGTISQQQH